MKNPNPALILVLLSALSGCSTPSESNTDSPPQVNGQISDQPENRKLGQVLSMASDIPSNSEILVVDLGQRLAYLIEKNGRILESIPVEPGQTLAIKGKKEDYRPPTGIFNLELTAATQSLKFVSKLPVSGSKNVVREFLPVSVPGKIEEYSCRTQNCLAFKSQDLEKLKQRMSKGPLLSVLIRRGEWLSEESHVQKNQNIERFFSNWESSWENRDIAKYMSFYAQDFTHPSFNRARWNDHKAKLFSTYKKIEVGLGPKTILNFGSIYFAQFNQKFNSELYSDAGVKTLVISVDESPRIIFEDWTPSTK